MKKTEIENKTFKPDLSVNIAGLKLKNPVIAASGTFGFGREFSEYFDLNMLGGIAVKGLTLEPREGNRPPRIAETPSGILNSVGLQNPGAEEFIRKEIPFLRRYDTAIIANIAGSSEEDYLKIADKLSDTNVDAIELNISCPNVKEGCAVFGSTPKGVFDISSKVRAVCRKPLIVKLTPNTADIAENAKAAEEAGADAVSLINTLQGMVIDIDTRKPVLYNNYGGLSGPAVRPVAVRMVHEAASAVSIPVIGMGGIMTGRDAIEFLLAGASAVMVGTANFVKPTACIDIINDICDYFVKNKLEKLGDLVGKVELNV